jgi:hypothetical protein
MPIRALSRYIVALVLGILTLYPYFLLGGAVSSRLEIWVKLIAYAALFFSPVRLLGSPQYRLALAFCLPVVAISLILGFPGLHNLLGGLQLIAEPIVCVWLGASLACIVLRLRLLHR